MDEFDVDAITDVTPIGENFKMVKRNLDSIIEKHTIRVIDVSNFLMQKLDIDIFKNFLNLIVLNLSKNKLTDIENGILDHSVNLETIDLSLNFISSINDFMFVNNIKLQTINLSKNLLSTINYRAFSSLNNLCNLNLSYNQIDHIDDLCLSCTHLKIFDLSYNKINDIDVRAFLALIDLVYLNLSNNQITKLPQKIFYSIKKLENLNLSNNKIESLNPRIFSRLYQLATLNLNSNKLNFLGLFLFYCNYKLRDLDVFNNNIIKFDKTVFIGSYNLRILKLMTCSYFNSLMIKNLRLLTNFELFSVCHQILDLRFFRNISKIAIKKLKIVFRNANLRLTTVLNSFENLELLHIEFLIPSNERCEINFNTQLNNLSNLQHLTLKNINKLYFVTSRNNPIFKTKNIDHLDLTGVQNAHIDDLIKQLRKLTYLNLSFSNISRIKHSTLLELKHLRCLILKNSKITSLSRGLFRSNLKLEVLDFENCPIEIIDDNVFQNLANLLRLNLKGIRLNPVTGNMLNGVPSTIVLLN